MWAATQWTEWWPCWWYCKDESPLTLRFCAWKMTERLLEGCAWQFFKDNVCHFVGKYKVRNMKVHLPFSKEHCQTAKVIDKTSGQISWLIYGIMYENALHVLMCIPLQQEKQHNTHTNILYTLCSWSNCDRQHSQWNSSQNKVTFAGCAHVMLNAIFHS